MKTDKWSRYEQIGPIAFLSPEYSWPTPTEIGALRSDINTAHAAVERNSLEDWAFEALLAELSGVQLNMAHSEDSEARWTGYSGYFIRGYMQAIGKAPGDGLEISAVMKSILDEIGSTAPTATLIRRIALWSLMNSARAQMSIIDPAYDPFKQPYGYVKKS